MDDITGLQRGSPEWRACMTAAERAERDAWRDFFDAVPETTRKEFSIASGGVSGVSLLASQAVPIVELNRGMAIGVDGPTDDGLLDGAVAWLNQHASDGWALQVPPFALTAELKDGLGRLGLREAGAGWAKFCRSASAPYPDAVVVPIEVNEVDVERASVFGDTVQGGFGLPPGFAVWFAALVGRPRWHCFLAYLEGQPAGAAVLHVSGDTAWMGMAATLPAHRGKGLQGSLIVQRIAVAAREGAKRLTTETGHPTADGDPGFSSFRNQKRHGFELAYVRANFKRPS